MVMKRIEKGPGDIVLYHKKWGAKEKKVSSGIFSRKIKEPGECCGAYAYEIGSDGNVYYSQVREPKRFQDFLKLASYVELGVDSLVYNPVVVIKFLTEDYYTFARIPAIPGVAPVNYFLNGDKVDVVLNTRDGHLKESVKLYDVVNTLFVLRAVHPVLSYENGHIRAKIRFDDSVKAADEILPVINAYENVMRNRLESCDGTLKDVFTCLRSNVRTQGRYHLEYLMLLASEKSERVENASKGLSMLWDYLDPKIVNEVLGRLEEKLLAELPAGPAVG